MIRIQFLLPFVLLLAACHKHKEPTVIITHYPQEYVLYYNTTTDSATASASLASKSDHYIDGVPVTMTMNGTESATYDKNNMFYQWYFKGMQDAAFIFSTHGSNLTNTVKAANMKTYQFINLPDTVSIAAWKSMQWIGDPIAPGESFTMQLTFSDNTDTSFTSLVSTKLDFNQGFLAHKKPLGKTLCRVQWYSSAKALQMPDLNETGALYTNSSTDKYIWLVP